MEKFLMCMRRLHCFFNKYLTITYSIIIAVSIMYVALFAFLFVFVQRDFYIVASFVVWLLLAIYIIKELIQEKRGVYKKVEWLRFEHKGKTYIMYKTIKDKK